MRVRTTSGLRHNCDPLDTRMIPPLVSKVKPHTLVVSKVTAENCDHGHRHDVVIRAALMRLE